jgi:hypothetical protein
MTNGARRLGLDAKAVPGFESPQGDVGIAYGWGHPTLFEAYRRRGGHFVYMDLGWWNRKPPHDVLGGFHKVVVDGREPGEYFRANMPADRFAHTGVKLAPWRQAGRHILVAGMSEKSARTRGWQPQQWETATIGALAKIYPDRPIVYRPKPSWVGASPIQGAAYSPPTEPLEKALQGAWAVVACHSNVAVDALAAGIPVHVEGGVAAYFNTPLADFARFEPREGREQLMADIAYCQFTPSEMASGLCLRHLLDRTPLCA